MNIILFIKKLILFQIIFSVIKILLIGGNEALVGTISYTSGSVATIFPIIAFIFIFKYSDLSKNNKTWLYWLVGLLLISIASNKRSIWFFMPIIFSIIYYSEFKIKLNI